MDGQIKLVSGMWCVKLNGWPNKIGEWYVVCSVDGQIKLVSGMWYVKLGGWLKKVGEWYVVCSVWWEGYMK